MISVDHVIKLLLSKVTLVNLMIYEFEGLIIFQLLRLVRLLRRIHSTGVTYFKECHIN